MFFVKFHKHAVRFARDTSVYTAELATRLFGDFCIVIMNRDCFHRETATDRSKRTGACIRSISFCFSFPNNVRSNFRGAEKYYLSGNVTSFFFFSDVVRQLVRKRVEIGRPDPHDLSRNLIHSPGLDSIAA